MHKKPPSPLIFSPETILSSPLNALANNVSSSNPHNTVSMPFVRRHVTRRLKAAKAECDRELQRVTNNITAFFEERLREGDDERELREFQAENQHLRDSVYTFHPSDLRSALQADESASEGGFNDVDSESSGRHSRQRGYPEQEPNSLTRSSSSSGIAASSSASLSPGSRRRQSTSLWDRPALSTSVSTNTVASSPAASSIVLPDVPITRKQSTAASSPAWSASGGNPRRLSRSIHISTRSRSGRSSRSTSRSRSPLPHLSTHSSPHDLGGNGTSAANRRASRMILVDDPVDPIMTALYDLIGVATDITEMSVTQLTAQAKVCEGLVGRVQIIGKAWDDHPDWHGRNWYVQVLLAVASLSRVVEWWEAEKQFWNFDEDNETELDEPLMFVTKSAEEATAPTPTAAQKDSEDSDLDSFKLNPDDENKLRLTRPASHSRRSRDVHPKELTLSTVPSEDTSRSVSHAAQQDRAESARILATERLRLQAETAQNQNIVIELSLDGDHLIWVNYAWNVVVGTDPEELYGTRLSRLLAPGDWNVFRDATHRLQDDDSHTVEARFRLLVEPEENLRDVPPPNSTMYQQMEAKGMLMIDREDGEPSHTMWVVRPLAPPRWEDNTQFISLEQGDVAPEPASSFPGAQQAEEAIPNSPPSAGFPFPLPVSTDPILCRICECQIPQWYFEKHSETCAETHRLEAEVAEFNESLDELRNTIRDLAAAMDRENDSGPPPEYRGMPIYSPSSSPVTMSPLQLLSRSNKMQRLGVKRIQRRLLDQLEDILQVAAEVSMPALKDDEAKEPIERQRLLSPSSERKITQIRTWAKPTMEDPALSHLIADAERIMRGKVDNVVRMQNTIRYSEKIWREWEEKIAEMVGEESESSNDEGSERGTEEEDEMDTPCQELVSSDAPFQDEDDDHSSTTAEYAFSGDPAPVSPDRPSVPISTLPPVAPSPERPASNMAIRAIDGPSTTSTRAVDIPTGYPPARTLQSRSGTPSSISSPLALAEPIVASSDPSPLLQPDTNKVTAQPTAVKPRSSLQNLLEPKFVVTPPASPLVIPRDADKDFHDVLPAPSLRREPSRKRHSAINPVLSPPGPGPLSPRHSSAAPIARTTPTSIKDFDIIKPISKGAFGSVFLAKKKATGDYFAIKVLKKADMIAKNQITNVKAERMILMKQAESPFVAKLFFTFQSKENLYLVMEYLNGGDCGALIKSLGSLPEEWTRNYIAEVVLGLEYLHERGIVHRDLKPDNLLIDQHGHLKLTDFGLSRIGLLGRQTRERDAQLGRPQIRPQSRSRPPSMDSAFLSSPLTFADIASAAGGSYFNLRSNTGQRHPYSTPTDDVSESSGSESFSNLLSRRNIPKSDSPLQSFASELTTDLRSHSHSASGGGGTPPGKGEQKFAGTPDYLAPEVILGLRGDDAAVDWWALGVVTYEFLYGIPPFHAETPEKVFENILSGHIEWHEEWIDFSEESRDFMASLMTLDPADRLGANGAAEVKEHLFMHGMEWDKVTEAEAAFIPQVSDPESTDYFDPRGAIPQLFYDDDQVADNQVAIPGGLDSPSGDSGHPSPALSIQPTTAREPSATSPSSDDFGSFSFKNLPVLKQANDDVIRKLKTDQMAPIAHALSEPVSSLHGRKRSISHRAKKPPSVVTTVDPKSANPPSPATSTSSLASSPSRSSMPTTPGSAGTHSRKHSEYGAVERFKVNLKEGPDRRSSMSAPSRLRTASVSSAGDGSGSETWNTSSVGHGSHNDSTGTAPSSVHSIDLRKGPDPNDRAVTCLLAEDNPITSKIIETLLIRLGCRCVVVADGSEAISVAMGDIKFDCILMDLHMPVLDGEGAARYIRSTNSKNTTVPIVAVSAYSDIDPYEDSKIFTAYLAKPVQKTDLLAVMRQLGFKTMTIQGAGPAATKVTAAPERPIS